MMGDDALINLMMWWMVVYLLFLFSLVINWLIDQIIKRPVPKVDYHTMMYRCTHCNHIQSAHTINMNGHQCDKCGRSDFEKVKDGGN